MHGGFAEPADGLAGVFGDAGAADVEEAKLVLGQGVSPWVAALVYQ